MKMTMLVKMVLINKVLLIMIHTIKIIIMFYLMNTIFKLLMALMVMSMVVLMVLFKKMVMSIVVLMVLFKKMVWVPMMLIMTMVVLIKVV